ncbi:hypothetical protein Tco_1219599 [Tanacetum coccineum]
MDNPNITIEEYIRIEEEKARRRGKVYNWETATYGKIWDNEDVHDLRSIETEFPAIVFNDTLTSEAALPCEPTLREDYKSFPMILRLFSDLLCSFIRLLDVTWWFKDLPCITLKLSLGMSILESGNSLIRRIEQCGIDILGISWSKDHV